MTLKTPLSVIEGHSAGTPSIVEAGGRVIASFGNFRNRGGEWCWGVARQLARAVNEEPQLRAAVSRLSLENVELRNEVERLKAKCNRLLDSLENEGVYQDYNDYVAEKEES